MHSGDGTEEPVPRQDDPANDRIRDPAHQRSIVFFYDRLARHLIRSRVSEPHGGQRFFVPHNGDLLRETDVILFYIKITLFSGTKSVIPSEHP